MKKIIALLGSFNPITVAHYGVLSDAVDKFGADEGVFIATNHDYLTRKSLLKTHTPTSFILPDDARRQMIESLAAATPKLTFGGFELGGASPNAYKTLLRLQKEKITQYKDNDVQLYLLLGADKLRHLHGWDSAAELLDLCDVLVYERAFDIPAVIANDPFLSARQPKIHVLHTDIDVSNVSSTEVRRRFFADLDFSTLMPEGAYRIMQQYTPADFPPITLQDVVRANLKYGGIHGLADANGAVFADNCALFDAWTDPRLGNRAEHRKAIAYAARFTVTVPEQPAPTVTGCVNDDCVDVAKSLLDEGLKPAILNLASRTSPGGGYHKGCSAQEESLCYASTLSQSLYQFGSPKYKHIRESGLTLVPGVYPMDQNFGGIYSPTVTFFRYGKDKYYADRETPFDCPVVSVASLSNRAKNDVNNVTEQIYFKQDGTMTEQGRAIEANKIRTIYRIALANGRDSLVLGAFGCGVFKLLPDEVAGLFRDVLAEPEFKNRFKKIVFAILEGKPSPHKAPIGRDGKFAPFYDIFGG